MKKARAVSLGVSTLTWVALAWCGSLHAEGLRPAVDARSVDVITLEHGCFGCDDAYLLVLRRDGKATKTTHGNARQGTQDRTLHGRVDGRDVDRLARLAVADGFFAMDDRYEDPELRDGAWTTLALTHAHGGKQVFIREDAAPGRLRALVEAVDATGRAIAFAR